MTTTVTHMNKSGEEQLVHGVGVAVLVHHLRWGEQTRWPKGVDVVHLSSGKFNNTISVAMTKHPFAVTSRFNCVKLT